MAPLRLGKTFTDAQVKAATDGLASTTSDLQTQVAAVQAQVTALVGSAPTPPTISAFGATLIDDADAPTALTTLGAMSKATYDPTGVNASAFNRANHTGTMPVSALSNAGILSNFRNKIINGNFDFWQRSTATVTANGYIGADMWRMDSVGSAHSAIRVANPYGLVNPPWPAMSALRASVTTSVAGASNYTAVYQRIEDCLTLNNKTATLTFWVRSSAAFNVGVVFTQNFGTGGSPSASVVFGGTAVAVTTFGTKYNVTVAIPSCNGKTLGTNGDDFLQVTFYLEAGATVMTTNGLTGITSGVRNIDLMGVSLVEGDATAEADPMSYRPKAIELLLCQRHFTWLPVGLQIPVSGAGLYQYTFPVEMRAVPTQTLRTTGSGASATLSTAFGSPTNRGGYYQITSSAVNGYFINYQYNFDAGL